MSGNCELEISDDISATLVEDNGNCTLYINEIEISNANRWSTSATMQDFIQDNRVVTQTKKLYNKIRSYSKSLYTLSDSNLEESEVKLTAE